MCGRNPNDLRHLSFNAFTTINRKAFSTNYTAVERPGPRYTHLFYQNFM